MSRLSDLYNAMETLRKEDLPVNEELEKKASQAEEEIIKNEILPILKQRIGLRRIHALGIMHNGYNLVSHDKHPLEPNRIFQHELDGWYIYSNMSNKDKKRDLQTISDRLGLHLTIADGKPAEQL